MKNDVTPLGESRSLVVKQFKALERSLRARSQSKEFADAVQEYFDMRHAELIPVADLSKPYNENYDFLCTQIGNEFYKQGAGRFSTHLLKLHPAYESMIISSLDLQYTLR